MAITVADLQAVLRLDTTQFQAGVAAATTSVKTLADQAPAFTRFQNINSLGPIFKSGITDPARGATAAVQELHGSSLLLREGIAKLGENAVPGFGRGILQATTHMSAMSLAMFGLAAAGVALITRLHEMGTAFSELSAKAALASNDILTAVHKADAEVAVSRAKLAGDEVSAAKAGATGAIQASIDTRNARVINAEEAARKVRDSWTAQVADALGIGAELKAAEAQLRLDRASAEAASAKEIEAINKKLGDDLANIARLTTERIKLADIDRVTVARASVAQIAAIQAGTEGNRPAEINAELGVALANAAGAKNAAIVKANEELRGNQQALAAELKRIWSDYNQQVAVAWEQSTAKITALARQLPAELSASLQGVGGPFDRLREQLDLSAAMEKAREDFAKWGEGVKLGTVSAGDALDVIQRKMRDLLDLPGAKSSEILKLMPAGLKDAAEAADRLANSVVRAGNAFAQTAGQAKELERASRGVEDAFTGHSLDKSSDKVAEALRGVKQASDWAAQGISTAGAAADAAAKMLAEMPLWKALNFFIPGMNQGTQMTSSTPPSFAPLAGGRSPFAFPMGSGDKPLSRGGDLGPFGLQAPSITALLQAIQQNTAGSFYPTGNVFGVPTGIVPGSPQVKVGDTPFGPVFKDAFIGLEEAARELKAAAQAQRMTAEFTANVLAPAVAGGIGGGFGGGGGGTGVGVGMPSFQTERPIRVPGPTGMPRPAIVHGGEGILPAGMRPEGGGVTVHINGPLFLDDDRRMNRLAEELDRRMTTQRSRRLGRSG